MRTATASNESRRERRLKVFIRGSVQCGAERYNAHLLDVSKSGAQVYCDADIGPGAFVIIECAGVSRAARCVRSGANRIGLKFTLPLSANDLAQLIERH